MRSILLNTVLPFKSCKSYSTVGIGCLSRMIASFARRMSTHTLTSPSALGTTTKGEIHPEGPSGTSYMMSSSRSSSSFLSTLSRSPNGILRTGWTIGFTDSSIWSLSSYPFKRPIPVNMALYFSRIQLSSPPLSTLFAWKGPMSKRLRTSAVSRSLLHTRCCCDSALHRQ